MSALSRFGYPSAWPNDAATLGTRPPRGAKAVGAAREVAALLARKSAIAAVRCSHVERHNALSFQSPDTIGDLPKAAIVEAT